MILEQSEMRSSCHLGVKETMQRVFKQEEEKRIFQKGIKKKAKRKKR